jgi:aspartate carbamoyltransferase catalytic subunit
VDAGSPSRYHLAARLVAKERHMQHVIESQQFDRPMLDHVFSVADDMRAVAASGGNALLKGRIMATLFYEPSTRTRLSFEAAMTRLGGQVLTTENAREFSSVAKGETLEDTVRVVGCYADVLVIRHYESGAAKRAAAYSPVPVINAGDGPGQHPTQALLDLYTIRAELGRIDGRRVAMVGDLANGRTVRSLAYLLALFEGIELIFVAPPVVAMREDIKDHLRERGVPYREEEDLRAVLPACDVVYQTRIQKERFADRSGDYEQARGVYIIDRAAMDLLPRDSIVLHPLPRVGEIRPEVDDDPRAAYFRQVANGVYVRMALLKLLLVPDL